MLAGSSTLIQAQIRILQEPFSVFLDELTPLWQEFSQQPVAFLGGFLSGVFRLNLSEDPVKSWLDQQAGSTTTSSTFGGNNGNSGAPKSISID